MLFNLRIFLSGFCFNAENSGGVEVFKVSEPWRSRRSLAEQNPAANSSLILARERTNRTDPLANFKPYTGGWNIGNKHYWAVSSLSQWFL